MDMISLGFYAAVCGVLSATAPVLGRFPVRFAIGVLVGLTAAYFLPLVKTTLGSAY